MVDLSVNVGGAGEGAAEVSELLHSMKLLPFDSDAGFVVCISWGGLVHSFCLLCTDGETKVVTTGGESVHLILHLGLIWGIKGAVISKEKVSDDGFLHSRDCLHSPDVKQFPVASVLDVKARVAVSEGVLEHGRKDHAEERRGQDTALLDSVGHRERL